MPGSRTFTFLGTGTSVGVPMIGCDCAVCRSTDPRNHRYRCAVLIGTPAGQHPHRHAARAAPAAAPRQASASSTPSCTRITTPTTCSAWTTCGPSRNTWAARCRCTAPARSSARSARPSPTPSPGASSCRPATFLPKLIFQRITEEPFTVLGQRVTPIPLIHAHFDVFGFRIGDVAYCTDVNHIPQESWPLLEGLRVLVLDALRLKPHPAHFGLDRGPGGHRTGRAAAGLPDAHGPRAGSRGDQPHAAGGRRAGLRRAEVRVLIPSY